MKNTSGTKYGFDGFLAKFEYSTESITPREAWSKYKDGHSSGMLGNLMSSYGLKIAFMKNDKEQGSFEI